MQRTKISALAVAAPPLLQEEPSENVSGLFLSLVFSIYSLEFLQSLQEAKHVMLSLGHNKLSTILVTWDNGLKALLRLCMALCKCFASLYFGFTECLSLIRLLYKNYQRLSGSNSRNVFLTVLEGGKSVIQQLWCLARTYFLVRR